MGNKEPLNHKSRTTTHNKPHNTHNATPTTTATMIIKSMSRKHPSFAQLIDYIEGESKLKSREYSVYHNTYHRKTEQIKQEFEENAHILQHRKNGVYLYHEVISITRSHTLSDHEQKTILQRIVREYLNARAKRNLGYAVLHEDTDNLHFHLVISANEAGSHTRKRLSKEQFSEIQNRLEAWVLQTYPHLEQKAVFHQNQTTAEREARKEQKTHLSNRGESMKRRGGKTSIRDAIQEQLTDIFETATNPQHFAEMMEQAGFTLYSRGNTHGITDRDGTKYRLNRLGLTEAWHALESRMMQTLQEAKKHAERMQNQAGKKGNNQEKKSEPGETQKPDPNASNPHKNPQADNTQNTQHTDHKEAQGVIDPVEEEARKRLAEIRAKRAKNAHTAQTQQQHQKKT